MQLVGSPWTGANQGQERSELVALISIVRTDLHFTYRNF